MAYERVAPGFDDGGVDLSDAPAALAAEALAYIKAGGAARSLRNGIILGADTVVVVGDRALGKPRDAQDARAMLSVLFDRPHRVITGVALIDAADHRCAIFHDTSGVLIRHPGGEAFERYLEAGEWRGKAGGYNLGQLESRWRFDIDGDPTNVIGLPMKMLAEQLERFTAAP